MQASQPIPRIKIPWPSPLATDTISHDSSWYRPDPNTYQNTTVITINRTCTNITLKFENGSFMVNNATRTSFEATMDYPQDYVLINNTIPEMAYKELSFTADGVTYAKSTADSKDFVSFNYTGNWSTHTFEWVPTEIIKPTVIDVNGNGVVNVVDLDFIRDSIVFLLPCSICDVDSNGVVNLYDVMLVSSKISK